MTFHKDASTFLQKLEQILIDNKVVIESHWDIDHLCYRVGSLEKYEALKKEFTSFSTLLIESSVNGRMISTFKLQQPVRYKNWRIDVVELPAPKAGKVTIEGFEHVEVVSDLSFEELRERFSHVKLDEGGLSKKINQELELCFGDINLKFHPLSLESLINIEGNRKIWSAIEKSDVLSVLKEYSPLIAGTFPLNMQIDNSDLDFLIRLKNKDELKALSTKTWGGLRGFKIKESEVDGLETVIVKFSIDGVQFEIFAQDLEPVKQKAYKHFLVEERLVKIKGPQFLRQVVDLKNRGMKTEPAIATILNLKGDPYVALLDLQKKSI